MSGGIPRASSGTPLTWLHTRYDLAWTFPRSFHVSPFNSRNGYYRLDIVDPFVVPNTTPNVKVFLRVLTPTREAKLQALLASSSSQHSIPLAPGNTLAIIRTILRYPVALLLTTLRILYQAYLLHYDKKLLVYPRPEPRVKGDERDWNPSEVNEGGLGVGVGWQAHSWGERKSRIIIEEWAKKRAQDTGIDCMIVFRDRRPDFSTTSPATSVAGNGKDRLLITTADPKIFTHLLSAPTAQHFFLLAPELLTTISSKELFTEYFAPSRSPSGRFDTMIEAVRSRHLRWYWTRSCIPPTPDLVSYDSRPIFSNLGLTGLCIVFMSYFADILEVSILEALEAKFVEGREPWKLWERAVARQYQSSKGADVEGGTKQSISTGLRRRSSDGSETGGEWVDLGSVRYET